MKKIETPFFACLHFFFISLASPHIQFSSDSTACTWNYFAAADWKNSKLFLFNFKPVSKYLVRRISK